MTSVGDTLRRERLRRGFELDQISRELKISPRFLDAIEDDDFKKLPGGVFAKSFVRQYARLLCLDEEELASEVQRLVEPAVAAAPIIEPPRAIAPSVRLPRFQSLQGAGGRRSPLPALAMVVVVMLVCSGIYSWWQRRVSPVSAHQQVASAVQPAPPVKVDPPASAPAPVQEQPAAVPAATDQAPAAKPDLNSADRPAVDPGASPQPPQSQPAAAEPAPSGAAARAVQPSNGSVKLEMTAQKPVWVLAQSNGKFLFSGTIDANQTRTVEADGAVTVRLGNSGNITFTLNGKPIGMVEPKGQVLTVQFTSGGFQIVAAPKPALLDPLGLL